MALRADDVDLGRDRDLVARFQNGDPEAFDDLYRRYFDRLHRFCRRHTGDSHEAEEVAQEAFVRALRSIHSLEGERRFYPWMTVIAKRITIDRHRKMSRVELTDAPDLGTVEPDIDHLFAAVDAAQVRRAMSNLGPRHREVLLLREAEGMSYAAIADHLEVPTTTVEALLHRARKALRREYAEVTGERQGLLGLPVLGWLGAKCNQLRARLGDHWVEIGAVGAPVAVGAVTAALVLVPGPGSDHRDDAAALPAASSTADAAPVPDPGSPVTVDVAPADLGPGTPPPTSAGSSRTAAPALGTPAADVFVGPEGTEQARQRANDMPLNGSVGPATGGADGPAAGEDAVRFLAEALGLVTGDRPAPTADDGTADPEGDDVDGADAPTRSPIHDLLGGTP